MSHFVRFITSCAMLAILSLSFKANAAEWAKLKPQIDGLRDKAKKQKEQCDAFGEKASSMKNKLLETKNSESFKAALETLKAFPFDLEFARQSKAIVDEPVTLPDAKASEEWVNGVMGLHSCLAGSWFSLARTMAENSSVADAKSRTEFVKIAKSQLDQLVPLSWTLIDLAVLNSLIEKMAEQKLLALPDGEAAKVHSLAEEIRATIKQFNAKSDGQKDPLVKPYDYPRAAKMMREEHQATRPLFAKLQQSYAKAVIP